MELQASKGSPGGVAMALKSGTLQVSVVGLGRIGLPTAALFAKAGATVTGIDIDPEAVRKVRAGKSRFDDEPGLSETVASTTRRGKLKATTEFEDAISHSDFIVICVPTPVSESKSPDYSAVSAASRAIGRSLKKGSVVIVESTVGPGTVEGTIQPLLEEASGLRAGVDFGLASCPERSDPGSILKNMSAVPRIVGAKGAKWREMVSELYHTAFGVEIVKVSDPKTANAVKLTENLFRDVNIALSNEFALLYEKLGIDVIEVINACSTKYNFIPHYPGGGVGGPCLPSNPYYLISEGVKVGNIPHLVRLAREINDGMPDHVVQLVVQALNEGGKTVRGSKVAILGASYKPDVKDVQLSPVQRVVARLRDMGAELSLYDPYFVGDQAFGIRVSKSALDAAKRTDCVVIGTAHSEFRKLSLRDLAEVVNQPPTLVDARNVFEPKLARAAGFRFLGVGRTRGENQ
jgi:nucleotide sugar dehydrogenase